MTSRWPITVCILAGLLACNQAFAESVVGWVDNVKIYPGSIALHARMDSGAKNSSLRVTSMRPIERDGEPWLIMELTDRKGRLHTLQAQVVRHVRIKRHDGGLDRRPVIALGVCVGTVYKTVEASIADRADFNYPVLVGRDFLAGSFLIDSARTYVTNPKCRDVSR